MRSRTELVTTTFDLDSDEEDFSPDDDDSEEDWRPNKKPQQKQARANGNNSSSGGGGGGGSDAGGGRKRKAVATAATKAKRRATVAKVSDEDFESIDDDDDELDTEQSDEDEDNVAAGSSSGVKRMQSLPPKKQFVKLAQLDLLLKKRDISDKDWLQNSRLCLWRKDEQTNLLQKYLRVKTSQDAARPNEQQLIFTSSSVYSSWDEQHLSDFIEVKVNCLDPNSRRIQLNDLEAIKKLSVELQAAKEEEAEAEIPADKTTEAATEQQLPEAATEPEPDENEAKNEDDDGA